MGKWLLAVTIAVCGTALVATDVEARRLGGARSSGAQRNVTTPPPVATPAKPGQQQAAQPAAAPGAAQPAAKGGFARWLPMLGGLALGGMLGWLLATNGGSFLLLALLAAAGVAIALAIARRRQVAQPIQYAGGPRETVGMPQPAEQRGASPLAPQGASTLPAGFDAAGFLRGAKMNFMRLQAANDRGQLDELREFTTPELFEELSRDVRQRGGAAQQTDVYGLEAELLEVATEADRHWASVRFSGSVREEAGAAPEPFSEVWNLAKPVDGTTGWLLAGIQQPH